MSTGHDYDEIDLSTLEFWAQAPRTRDEALAMLRRDRPMSFHRPITFGLASMLPEDESGYWALVRHEDVRYASLNPEIFCSSRGVVMEDVPEQFREQIGSFLVMDGSRHTRLRRLITGAFTPRNVARIEEQIAHQASRIVDELLEVGDCDFVSQVAMRLPLWTISEIVGVADDDRERIASAANTMVSTNDPEYLADDSTALATVLSATVELHQVAVAMAQDRRAHPRDDVMTALVQAEIDGKGLTDEEIGAFMVLLSVAGNDTTRNTTSSAMRALCEHPEQRSYLTEDPDRRLGPAIEEFIRWATPVMQFRRTATRDVELHGEIIREGDKVALLYVSANRDEAVFAEPWRFDVTREPNDHLGFGGGGPHYCLGARLAKTQLRTIFTQLLTRLPTLEVGEPEYIPGTLIAGIKRMPCRPKA